MGRYKDNAQVGFECYASYFFYIRSAHRDLEDVKKY